MNRMSIGARCVTALTVALVAAGCGGGPPTTPTPAPPTAPPVSAGPPTAPATQGATGPASLEAPDTVGAGVELEVTWTGPNGPGDYVTIVPAGTTEWTNQDYFYTTEGNPGRLSVPASDGAYELWYVSGADKAILARRSLTVTPFSGDLLGPATVVANTEFEVAWEGPNGRLDYVTIVKAGSAAWTNEDYFYTADGTTGTLLAPLEPGAYELWYVIGSDRSPQLAEPITVTAASATLEGPDDVARGASFEVTWTGPNGPGDYVTIVAKGADATAYLSYFYTRDGNPGTLTAPDAAGEYELRYIPGQAYVVVETVPITVK
jgi:Ca-activated chloride channel homolog